MARLFDCFALPLYLPFKEYKEEESGELRCRPESGEAFLSGSGSSRSSLRLNVRTLIENYLDAEQETFSIPVISLPSLCSVV